MIFGLTITRALDIFFQPFPFMSFPFQRGLSVDFGFRELFQGISHCLCSCLESMNLENFQQGHIKFDKIHHLLAYGKSH